MTEEKTPEIPLEETPVEVPEIVDESPQEEIVIYRHFLSLGLEIILFFVVAAAAFHFTTTNPEYIQEVKIGDFSFPLPLLLIFPVVIAAYLIHGLYNYKYIIGEHYVLGVDGVLSFKMQETRIDFEHIRGIEVDKSLYQRLLGLGDIKIGSAMKGDVEVIMKGVFKPKHYRDVIESRLRRHVEMMEIAGLKDGLRDTIREEIHHEENTSND